jgi:hypothetical protein
MTTQFIAIVKRTKEVTTKDGRPCTIIEASGNMKSEFAIWLGASHQGALALRQGDRITCTVDAKGKERWVENVPATRLSTGSEAPYTPGSQSSPLATMQKAGVQETSGAYDRHIENLASKIADCYRATQRQLPELSEEMIQKLATSVFIQLAKDTF